MALRTGRLANRIVLFANVIAFAEERGYRVLNPAFQTYAALFESTRDTLLCPYPPPPPRRPSRGRDAVYGTLRFTRLLYHMAFQLSRPVNRVPGLAPWIRGIESPGGSRGVDLTAPPISKQIRETRITLLRGWEFRDTVGVTRYADRIRTYFTPTTGYRAAVATRVAAARQGCNLLIGVHVRRGDYVDYMAGRYFYPVDRYRDLMATLQARYSSERVGFLVCSDAALRLTDFPGLPVTLGSGVAIEDLYALAACDRLVGPPSTFTQWASFYGRVPLYYIRDRMASPGDGDFAVASLALVV
ncbi:MAG: alpha-1,2-fucosyltransferase [Gammaproteobacteria bacterium]